MIDPHQRSHTVKKSRYTDEQIAAALKKAQQGTPIEEIWHQMDPADTALDDPQKKYNDMKRAELRRLKQLEK